jgi:hypothetical protein
VARAIWLSVAHRTIRRVRRQEANEREACCPVCRSRLHQDVVVGMIVLGDKPVFHGLIRHRNRDSDLRPWLDPTIECRTGHRLKVPSTAELRRALEKAPAGQPIYLQVGPPPKPIPLRLEGVPRT